MENKTDCGKIDTLMLLFSCLPNKVKEYIVIGGKYMGFFKDFKDDFSQAVNELLPDDVITESDEELLFQDDDLVNTLEDITVEKDVDDLEIPASDLERTDKIDANVEAFLKKVKALDEGKDLEEDMDFKLDDVMESDEDMIFKDAMVDVQEEVFVSDGPDVSFSVGEEDDLLETIQSHDDLESMNLADAISEAEVDNIISSIDNEEDKMITEIANEKDQMEDVVGLQEIREERTVNSSEVTVIGKNTVISGNISAGGSLEVYGKVEGDIDCGGKLSINGVVKGNSKAQEVFVNAKRLEGNVESSGNIKVGQGTVIVGDVSATAGVIAGAIKGQIDVKGAVVLDSTAIVKGNIKAKSVQINNGAVVDGYCSLVYAEVDLENVFDE